MQKRDLPAASAQPHATLPSRRVWLALAIALIADTAQWVWLPLMMQGAVSPINDVIDVFVAICMVGILGWHWQFLPTFFSELLPIVDLVPMWSLAVWLSTRPRPRRDLAS